MNTEVFLSVFDVPCSAVRYSILVVDTNYITGKTSQRDVSTDGYGKTKDV